MEEESVDQPSNNDEIDQIKSSNESLVNKNQELLNELKQLKTQINEMGGLDQVKEAVTTTSKLKEETLQKENSLEQLKAHYDEQIKMAQHKNNELVMGIVQSTIDTQLRSAVTKAKGSYTLLEHQLKNHIEGEYVDGQVKMTVKDKNGMPMMVEGKEATVYDLVNTIKTNEEFARAFDATPGITGSGAPTGNQSGVSKQPETLGEITELYRSNPAKALEVMKAKGLA